jgi:hypothetical protein
MPELPTRIETVNVLAAAAAGVLAVCVAWVGACAVCGNLRDLRERRIRARLKQVGGSAMVRGLGRGPLGAMPLGGSVTELTTIVAAPSANVFRRLEIKRRRASDGLYESDWQDISYLVKNWGTVTREIDAIRLNRFRNTGFDFVARNDGGKLNHEDNLNSLWYGYLTRYRTLVRVSGGYYSENGTTELPADPTLGIFLMDQEIPQSAQNNEMRVPCSSLQSVFDEVRSADIGGILGATLTASQILAKVRDHTDGSGAFVFRQFITSTAWTIESTTSYYVLTSDDLQGTTWDLMSEMAEAEAKVLLITRTGGIEFRGRDARTSTVAWTFSGQGFPRPNMIRLDEYREAWDKYYTYFRFKYREEDTTTSYVTAGTMTTVSPSNTPWKYGARTYDLPENRFVIGASNPTATAQAIVDRLHDEFAGDVPVEASWVAKFVPGLEVLDRVAASYHSYEMAGLTLWDTFKWDGAPWAVEGENFDWDDRAFKVLGLATNLDNFTVAVKAQEV